jgi:hypothetical protein
VDEEGKWSGLQVEVMEWSIVRGISIYSTASDIELCSILHSCVFFFFFHLRIFNIFLVSLISLLS